MANKDEDLSFLGEMSQDTASDDPNGLDEDLSFLEQELPTGELLDLPQRSDSLAKNPPTPLSALVHGFERGFTYEFADELAKLKDPEAKARFKASEESYPTISALSNLAGAIASPNPLGKLGAIKNASKAAKTAFDIGRSGLEGAITAYGASDVEGLEANLNAAAEGATIGALLSGAFKGVGAGFKKLGSLIVSGDKAKKAFDYGKKTGLMVTDPVVQEKIATDIGRISENLDNQLGNKINELGQVKSRLIAAHKGATLDIGDDLSAVYKKLDNLRARKNMTPDELAGLNKAAAILDRVDDSILKYQSTVKEGIDPITGLPAKAVGAISTKRLPIDVLDGFKQQAQDDAFNSNLRELNPAAFDLLTDFQRRAAKKIENYDFKNGTGDLARVNKALTALYEMKQTVGVPQPTTFAALLNPQNISARATAGRGGKVVSNYTTFMNPLRNLNPEAKSQYLPDLEQRFDASVTVPLEKLKFLKQVSGTLPEGAKIDAKDVAKGITAGVAIHPALTALALVPESKRLQLANWLGKNSATLSKAADALDTSTQFLARRGPAALGITPKQKGLEEFEQDLETLGIEGK